VTVQEAIAEAERILPGVAAPDGELDPRWQAIIEVEAFIETDPDEIWRFVRRWGCHEDEDLRNAIATCLLEDLLEYHFEEYFSKVEEAVRADRLFADTFGRCAKLGQAQEPGNAERFDRLQNDCQGWSP
jgi:hypothetical protein